MAAERELLKALEQADPRTAKGPVEPEAVPAKGAVAPAAVANKKIPRAKSRRLLKDRTNMEVNWVLLRLAY